MSNREVMIFKKTNEQKTTNVGFEVFTAVTLKNAVFWDVAPCSLCVNRCFGGTWLQPPAHVGSSLVDSPTLNMEAIRSSETSVHTRSTGTHIPQDGILKKNNKTFR
jgi:hypothetical protein